MADTTPLLPALTALALSLPAMAEDRPVDIQTDLGGRFFIVDQGGTPDRPTLLVRNSGPGFVNYVKREFDCTARTTRYLGSGRTPEETAADRPAPRGHPIEQGSIADQLARIVCPVTEPSGDPE